MISQSFFVFIAVSSLVALVNWRLGLALLIAVGALQDPVRKIMPGAPSLMVLAFLPLWMASFAGMFMNGQWRWRHFSFHYPGLKKGITLLVCAMLLAVVVLLYNYGLMAWKIAIIGGFSYSLPILSLLMGFSYARNKLDLLRFIRIYCLITALVLIGGVLELMHVMPDWDALGTSVLGIHWIRHISWGHSIEMIAGFYRSPEVMGWHAATLTILSLTMALYRKGGARWFWLLLACWGFFLVLVSGRNKMMGMVAVWVGVLTLIYYYHGQLGKVLAIVSAGGLLVVAIVLMSGKLNLNQDYIIYSSQLAEGSFIERIDRSVFSSLKETFRQSGFFGKGIGTSAQGIQHLGVHIDRSWQESGLSRILVELGAFGLLAILFFSWAMFKIIRRMVFSHRGSTQVPILQSAIASFAIANASNFAISHQVFSDGFILIILTLLIGMLLASPAWAQSQAK